MVKIIQTSFHISTILLANLQNSGRDKRTDMTKFAVNWQIGGRTDIHN